MGEMKVSPPPMRDERRGVLQVKGRRKCSNVLLDRTGRSCKYTRNGSGDLSSSLVTVDNRKPGVVRP